MKKKKLGRSLILKTRKKQSQAKVMYIGQQNIILKQRHLRLLKREFDKLSLEQKRIKEAVKHIQICISKREHYEGYRKNPNDKIYMMMNRKDVEAYQKSYEEIDIFLK